MILERISLVGMVVRVSMVGVFQWCLLLLSLLLLSLCLLVVVVVKGFLTCAVLTHTACYISLVMLPSVCRVVSSRCVFTCNFVGSWC